jgi:hypothetical protein
MDSFVTAYFRCDVAGVCGDRQLSDLVGSSNILVQLSSG